MTLIEMEAIKLMKQGFFSDLFSGISIMMQGKNGRAHSPAIQSWSLQWSHSPINRVYYSHFSRKKLLHITKNGNT